MDISTEIAVAIIVALVIYPFAVFGLALRISRLNTRSLCFVSILVATGIIGGGSAVAFLSTHRISKYTTPDIIAGILFTLAVAASGGLIGALCDRWIRPHHTPEAPSEG